MFKHLTVAVSLAALAIAPVQARGAGYSLQTGEAVNMDGARVPEVVVVIQPGARSLSRNQLQSEIRQQLKRMDVEPHLIALQSVATAAIQFAETQDRGEQSNCYENWCARVFVNF